MVRKWADKEVKYLRENYGKLSAKKLSEKLDRSYYSISQKASSLDLFITKHYSDNELEYLKENYGKFSVQKIAKNLERSTQSVSVKISKLGLADKSKRTYAPNVDMDFFNKWSPELAYIVGFFLADGCISDYEKHSCCLVTFSCSDRDVINKIVDVAVFQGNIYEIKIVGYKIIYKIVFSGRLIWDFFKYLGFDNNKSYTAKIPKQVPQHLIPHLVRGIFDGDGNIYLRPTTLYPYIKIVGTKDVVMKIGSIFNFYGSIRPISNCTFVISYNGKSAIDFMESIYCDSKIHMNRKYGLYLESLKWKPQKVRGTL